MVTPLKTKCSNAAYMPISILYKSSWRAALGNTKKRICIPKVNTFFNSAVKIRIMKVKNLLAESRAEKRRNIKTRNVVACGQDEKHIWKKYCRMRFTIENFH